MGNLLGRFFGGLEIKQGVTDDHVREFFDVLACHAIGKNEGLAVAHLPSVRVLAVLAAQRAAGHEHGHAGARSIHGGVDVPRVDEADITGFQGGKAVTSVESDWGFKAGKAAHQSLRGIGLRFLEHMPGRGAERGCCGHRCPPVPNDAKVCGK